MAPIPSANGAPFEVAEPKAGGEKSKKMHSQVVIIGSGPAGHTYGRHIHKLEPNRVR
jgi:thioredoxin reductase (NADPH)